MQVQDQVPPNRPNPTARQVILNYKEMNRQIEELRDDIKTKKENVDELKQKIISKMMQARIRQVDESGSGQGPFWTLVPTTKCPSLSGNKMVNYFKWLSAEIKRRNWQPSVVELCESAKQFLKRYESYGVDLKKMEHERLAGVEDIEKHLAKRRSMQIS